MMTRTVELRMLIARCTIVVIRRRIISISFGLLSVEVNTIPVICLSDFFVRCLKTYGTEEECGMLYPTTMSCWKVGA